MYRHTHHNLTQAIRRLDGLQMSKGLVHLIRWEMVGLWRWAEAIAPEEVKRLRTTSISHAAPLKRDWHDLRWWLLASHPIVHELLS